MTKSPEKGRWWHDWLFDNRQKADYRPMVQFDPEQVREILEKSSEFINEMMRMLAAG